MVNRILSTFTLLTVVALAIGIFGIYGCICLIVVAGALTQLELYTLLGKIGGEPMCIAGMICGVVAMIVAGVIPPLPNQLPAFLDVFLASFVAITIGALFSHSPSFVGRSVMVTAIGLIYAPFMCCFAIDFLHRAPSHCPRQNMWMLLWMVVVVKCCDIGGMLAGKRFGRYKIAPNFSPKKTIEGTIGGILASNAVGVLLFFLFSRVLPPTFTPLKLCTLATLLAALSLFGDLTESTIKRLADVKDSGRAIPGIGGVFDLTDSLLLSIPLGTLFLRYFL
jgi:phosphatidate cytidylyltransferase